jgi:PilZ domain
MHSGMNAHAKTPERRGAPRLRTLKGARLVLPNQISTFQCTVRNVSETGVGVELSSTLAVPSRVLLKMDDGSSDRMCEVVWRTETRLGLRFLS